MTGDPKQQGNATRHRQGARSGYFDSSPFENAQIAATDTKSRCLDLYEAFAQSRFEQLADDLTESELASLEEYHRARLDAEREERRMHLGAFALVSVLFFLLLPMLVAEAFQVLVLDAVALLLLALAVPYAFVYFDYENRVRAMALGLFRLMEARELRAERTRQADERPFTG
jgi:Flp pilus assembly protein TadB